MMGLALDVVPGGGAGSRSTRHLTALWARSEEATVRAPLAVRVRARARGGCWLECATWKPG